MTIDLLLIHGMCTTGRFWDPFGASLAAAGFRIHAPTLRHHKRLSEGSPDPRLGMVSLRDYVEDLEGLIADMDAKPIIIGHSMGGLLAQKLAARDRARALVLLAPAPPTGVFALSPSSFMTFASYLRHPLAWMQPFVPTRAEATYGVLNALEEDRHEVVYAERAHESGRAVWEIGFWWLDPLRAAYVERSAVRCPILACAGGRDRAAPPSLVHRIAARYPQSEVRDYPDRGHLMVVEPGWPEIAADITEWIKALPPQASTHD